MKFGAGVFNSSLWNGAAEGGGGPGVVDYDAMRGVVAFGPRLTGVVSIGPALSGVVSTGERLSGSVQILPGS